MYSALWVKSADFAFFGNKDTWIGPTQESSSPHPEKPEGNRPQFARTAANGLIF
jgi:hypothetical protein